jgi:hypothetical protein
MCSFHLRSCNNRFDTELFNDRLIISDGEYIPYIVHITPATFLLMCVLREVTVEAFQEPL